MKTDLQLVPGSNSTSLKFGKYRLNVAHKYAQQFVNKSKIDNKRYYDKNSRNLDIKVGDKVMIEDMARHKLDSIFKDNYVVKSVIGNNLELEGNGKKFIIH